jgi:hypothetical protein
MLTRISWDVDAKCVIVDVDMDMVAVLDGHVRKDCHGNQEDDGVVPGGVAGVCTGVLLDVPLYVYFIMHLTCL